jgi:hypothetical protein
MEDQGEERTSDEARAQPALHGRAVEIQEYGGVNHLLSP